MGVQRTKAFASYGVGQPTKNLFPDPIIQVRDPNGNDFGEIGQLWINSLTNDFWILTSILAGVPNWATPSNGAGIFASITVNPGDINVTAGNIIVAAGDITATLGSITAGTNLTAGGDILATGNITTVAGQVFGGTVVSNTTVIAGTTVTGGTGVIATTGGVTASAGNIVATLGDITASAGNIAATLGNMTAGGTITATGSITSNTGDIVATLGDIRVLSGDMVAENNAISAQGSAFVGLKSRAGGIITTGDSLGSIVFAGSDGVGLVEGGAGMTVTSTGTIGVGRVPAFITFATTPDAVSAPIDRVTVPADGGLVIAAPTTATTPPLVLLGPINIYTGAGAPAGGLAIQTGDIYVRTDAGGAAERIYVATGAGAWTNVTCAA